MSKAVHILGFAGSLRRTSYNAAALRAASELLPEGATLEIFDLTPLPLYNQDFAAELTPEPVKQFKARIAAADALLIATPEYNYSLPGVLKNAIDWASHPIATQPFNGKPTAIFGVGGRLGTARAQYHLRQIAVFINMLVLNKPELLIQYAPEKFDSDGNLTDAVTREQLSALLAALLTWTRRLQQD